MQRIVHADIRELSVLTTVKKKKKKLFLCLVHSVGEGGPAGSAPPTPPSALLGVPAAPELPWEGGARPGATVAFSLTGGGGGASAEQALSEGAVTAPEKTGVGMSTWTLPGPLVLH